MSDTRNAISGGLLAFSEFPDQWERLKADPGLLPTAVEEILRWVSPIIHFIRYTTENSEIHGVPIPAGDNVAIFFASGNRDEEVFGDPFTFRVDRTPNPHLAFGFGAGSCRHTFCGQQESCQAMEGKKCRVSLISRPSMVLNLPRR